MTGSDAPWRSTPPPNGRLGSSGGASNEIGSDHRAGVAAFLAAAALTDNPAVEDEPGIVSAIDLETDEPTDDLLVTMHDNTRWFVQAKRTGAIGPSLDDTARQWAAQLLHPGDRVVMASASFSRPLHDAQAVIVHDRSGLGPPPSAAARENLKRVTDRLDSTQPGLGTKARHSARFFHCDTFDNGVHAAIAAARLDSVVGHGNGRAALNVLIRSFQRAAGRRQRTTLADWVQALDDGKVPIIATPSGAAGQRQAMQQTLLSGYRTVLAGRADRLDVSTAVPGMRSVAIPNLLHSWELDRPMLDSRSRSRISGAAIDDVCRRELRVLIEGLPGMGKTTALEQLAARWAADLDAPTPLWVRFSALAGEIERPQDVTLHRLADIASRQANTQDQDAVRSAMITAASDGKVVFMIDGLDESFAKLPSVIAGLEELIPALHAETGWVVTSRPDAARHLNVEGLSMERTLLRHRGSHGEVVGAIMQHSAEQRGMPEPERDDWITRHSKWQTNATQGRRDPLFETPMVVSLIASHVARHDAPPESAIDILPAVLAERAASRSTLHGAAAPQGGWNLNIADDMALDVLIAVAHRLSTSETVSSDQAVRDAVASLSAWELPKPVADVVAKQLLWFWDERAAVLHSDNGFIRARSRRWIDAADAIWVSRQDEETLRAWALERLQASGSLEAFPPALATDARVLQVIITVAADTTSIGASAVAVLAEWAAQGRIGSADAAAAFSALTTHARGVEPTPTNHPTPHTAETDRTRLRLVALSIPLPREERAARHAFIQDVAASETDVLVLEAIAATTDAVADRRFAVPPEVRKAFESIDLAEPKRDPMERDLRTGVYSLAPRPRPRRPTGLIDFARHVINSEIEIKDEQAQWLLLAARTGSPDDWAQLTAALQSRGFKSRTPFLDGSFLDGIVESLKPLTELRWYLEPLIKLPVKQVPPDWRLRDLSALLRAILAYEPSRITGQATSRLPMDLEDWLTTTARYYRLSIEQLVADANYALAMPLPALGRLALLLCESKEPLAGHPEALEDAWATVARLLSSDSEWVSGTALEMLIAAKRRVPLPTEEDSSGAIATHVAYNTALAYAWAAGDPFDAACDLLTRGRPAYRRAAAVVLRAVASDDASEAAVLALKSDRDWSVRVTAGAVQVEAEGAAFWSCPDCDHENPGTDAIPCEQCGLSDRPDAEHQLFSLAAAQGPGQSTTSRTRHGASSATSGTRVAG